MIAVWLATGVLAKPSGTPPAPSPTPAGDAGLHRKLDWFWPGSKDDPIHEQIEREINESLRKPEKRVEPAKQEAPPERDDSQYWLQVSLLLAQFKAHANALQPILPQLVAADTRAKQKQALEVLQRSLRALQVILLMEQDER